MLLPFRSLQLFARVSRGELLVSGNRCRNRGEREKGKKRARLGWEKTRVFDRPRRRRGRAWGCDDAPQAHERLEHERHELLVPLAPPASSARAEQAQAAVDGVRAKSQRFPRRSHDRGARPRVAPARTGFSGTSDRARSAPRAVRSDRSHRSPRVDAERARPRRRPRGAQRLPRGRAQALLLARQAIGRRRFRDIFPSPPRRRRFILRHGAERVRLRPPFPVPPGAREHRDPRSTSLHRPRTSRGRGARTVRAPDAATPRLPFPDPPKSVKTASRSSAKSTLLSSSDGAFLTVCLCEEIPVGPLFPASAPPARRVPRRIPHILEGVCLRRAFFLSRYFSTESRMNRSDRFCVPLFLVPSRPRIFPRGTTCAPCPRFRCDVASTRDRSRRRATRVDPRRDAIDRGRSPSVGSRSARSARAVASGRTRRAGPARARSRPALNPPDDDERGFRRSLKGEFLFPAGVHRRGRR